MPGIYLWCDLAWCSIIWWLYLTYCIVFNILYYIFCILSLVNMFLSVNNNSTPCLKTTESQILKSDIKAYLKKKNKSLYTLLLCAVILHRAVPSVVFWSILPTLCAPFSCSHPDTKLCSMGAPVQARIPSRALCINRQTPHHSTLATPPSSQDLTDCSCRVRKSSMMWKIQMRQAGRQAASHIQSWNTDM